MPRRPLAASAPTNDGAVTWYDFARTAADACGALGSVRGRMMRSTEAALTAFATRLAG